jgi:hypothetical protein
MPTSARPRGIILRIVPATKAPDTNYPHRLNAAGAIDDNH